MSRDADVPFLGDSGAQGIEGILVPLDALTIDEDAPGDAPVEDAAHALDRVAADEMVAPASESAPATAPAPESPASEEPALAPASASGSIVASGSSSSSSSSAAAPADGGAGAGAGGGGAAGDGGDLNRLRTLSGLEGDIAWLEIELEKLFVTNKPEAEDASSAAAGGGGGATGAKDEEEKHDAADGVLKKIERVDELYVDLDQLEAKIDDSRQKLKEMHDKLSPEDLSELSKLIDMSKFFATCEKAKIIKDSIFSEEYKLEKHTIKRFGIDKGKYTDIKGMFVKQDSILLPELVVIRKALEQLNGEFDDVVLFDFFSRKENKILGDVHTCVLFKFKNELALIDPTDSSFSQFIVKAFDFCELTNKRYLMYSHSDCKMGFRKCIDVAYKIADELKYIFEDPSNGDIKKIFEKITNDMSVPSGEDIRFYKEFLSSKRSVRQEAIKEENTIIQILPKLIHKNGTELLKVFCSDLKVVDSINYLKKIHQDGYKVKKIRNVILT